MVTSFEMGKELSCSGNVRCGFRACKRCWQWMKETLCDLALQTVADMRVLPVLQDAVQEAGWVDERMQRFGKNLDTSLQEGRSWAPDNTRTWRVGVGDHSKPAAPGSLTRAERRSLPHQQIQWAKAVAATLLFEDWPTFWPLAEKLQRYTTLESSTSIMRRLYPQGAIGNIVFGTTRGTGMNVVY